MQKKIYLLDLGLTPYGQALALQHKLRQQLLDTENKSKRIGFLISLQHPLTVTIGKRATTDSLIGRQQLHAANAEVFKIDRGGEATMHNPGQLILYPILTLEDYHLLVVDLVRKTAYAAADAMEKYNIIATYDEELPGLWAELSQEQMEQQQYQGLRRRKIASVGMRISRGTSTHGIAINIINDLLPFTWIEACGLTNAPMAKVADFITNIEFQQFKEDVWQCWEKRIGVTLEPITLELPNKENWEQSNVKW